MPNVTKKKIADYVKASRKYAQDAVGKANVNKNANLTAAEAKALPKDLQDNYANFKKYGKVSTVKAQAFVDGFESYVSQAATAADKNKDGCLSAAEAKNLPKDLQDNYANYVAGKTTPPSGSQVKLDAALKALDIEPFTDYGMSFWAKDFPASATADEILKELGDLTDDDDLKEMFETTTGDAAVKGMKSTLKTLGADQIEYRDGQDSISGPDAKKLLDNLATAVGGQFSPASKFESVKLYDHGIQEDGDLERHYLLAKEKGGGRKAFAYTNFPF
jgi:hypothetical protein